MSTPIPAQGAGRIRWEPLLGGNFDGYVGTRAEPVFKLFLATPGTPTPWALRSELLEGYSTDTHPDELKAEAERWLEEFVSSLGAVFPPEPGENLPRQPLIHDLAIVLAGALHPGAHLTPGAKLVASRLRDVLGVGDGDRVYGRELTGARDIEAKLSAALGGEPSAMTRTPAPRQQERTEQ